MRQFLRFVSLFLVLICFPMPMMMFLQFLTSAELFARLNAAWFYPLAGIMWMTTIYSIATSYWNSDREQDRIWVVDERWLDDLSGIPYYQDFKTEDGYERQIDSVQKPTIVREIRK